MALAHLNGEEGDVTPTAVLVFGVRFGYECL
jgi:hypothetical protein